VPVIHAYAPRDAMKTALLVAAGLIACTAQAQNDNPAVAAIARETDSLGVAALARDAAAIDRLLRSGANVNQRSMNGTALEIAAGNGDVEIVQALLRAGAHVHASAVFDAARARDLEMVTTLLATDADLNYQGGVAGNTALMYGISQQSQSSPAPMQIARLLLEAGADVNRANNNGVTALLLAVQGRSAENAAMVEGLLARGADVDHRSCYYVPDSPLKNRSSYLRAVGATPLSLASSVGNDAAVRTLLGAGADPTLAQCDGRTALDLALANGHEEVASLLREAAR
jgi:ankyrin repeat protein